MTPQEKIVFVQDNKQVIQKGNHFFTRVFENGESFESMDFYSLEGAKKHLGIEPTIEENNQLIAEFLGWKKSLGISYHKENKVTTTKHFDFIGNNDWNGLMVAVDKIESLELKNESSTCEGFDTFGVEINKNRCDITHYGDFTHHLLQGNGKTRIESVYNAVLLFIKWYNKN